MTTHLQQNYCSKCKTLINTTPVVAGSVFINEIHYDNAGTDVNEGVEIAELLELTLHWENYSLQW
jgi:hypothetical protein